MFWGQGVDRIVFLSDAFELGREIDATVELLEDHGVSHLGPTDPTACYRNDRHGP